jgi:HlyD family secretion protein
MKKILVVVAVLAVAGAAAFALLRDGKEAVKYKTEAVARGDVLQTVTATGTVNPVTTVLVGTQVSGTIKDIYVDFNSPVTKGQLIARIDPATFEAQVAQARANLLLARANLQKAEATLVDARRTRDRNRELLRKDMVAQGDVDTAETNYETARAGVNASKAQVAQAEASLNNALTNLQYTRILSPVDGIVVSRNVDVGQTVAASFQTPTLFTIAQDLTKMQIDTNVDEADIGKVAVGQEVEFTVDAFPDVTFRGKVSQVRIAPIIVENVVTYDVVIVVDNPELKLKPGMTANVSIIVASKKGVLRIPNAALRFSPSQGGGAGLREGPGVWVLRSGRPARVPVTTGISDGMYTELLKGELGEGQQVIVESLSGNARSTGTRVPRMFH